jgi:serpin B
VELPYDGGQLSMVVIVPEPVAGDGGDALAALETGLTGDRVGAILASIAPSRVALSLPTFSFSSPFDLAQTLVDLGMVDAFGDADFSGIDDSGLRIAKVIHKAFVAIDEAGTEAAAATAVVTEPPSEPPPPIPVAVDRPFLFLVRDIPTGAVLFLGRVVDPR